MKYSIQYIGKNEDNIIFVFEESYTLVGIFLWAESNALEEYISCIN